MDDTIKILYYFLSLKNLDSDTHDNSKTENSDKSLSGAHLFIFSMRRIDLGPITIFQYFEWFYLNFQAFP